MIAIQTNECLYIINMGLAEFLESAANNALWESNPMIKAKMEMTFYNNSRMHFLNSVIPEIKCCARLVGDQFTLNFKPLESVKDLEFFVKDGKQYSCEQSYLFDASHGKEVEGDVEEKTNAPINPEIHAPINPEIGPAHLNPEVDASKGPISPETGAGTSTDEEVVGETKQGEKPNSEGSNATEEEEKLEGGDKPSNEDEAELDASGEEELTASNLESEETVNLFTEDQKKAAAALDNLIHHFPNINDLSDEHRERMAAYVSSNKSMFREIARKYLKSNGFQEDVEHLNSEYYVPNALGVNQEMIDSLLVFPEMVHILAKFDMSRNFSPSSIINSIFMRICPVGELDVAEGKKYCAYIQEFKITKEDYKEAERSILETYGLKSLRGLSSEQKRLYLEEALEKVYNSKYGSIASHDRRMLVEDADEYLQKYQKAYYFPDYLTWTQMGQYEFDAREKKDHITIPILTQIQSQNVFHKKSVKVAIVRTDGTEPISSYIELNEDLLYDVKDCIVSTPEGRVLKDYFWDESTQQRITKEEYMKILDSRSHESDTSKIGEHAIGDPFADETQTELNQQPIPLTDGGEMTATVSEEKTSGMLLSDTLNVQNVSFGGIPVQPSETEKKEEDTSKETGTQSGTEEVQQTGVIINPEVSAASATTTDEEVQSKEASYSTEFLQSIGFQQLADGSIVNAEGHKISDEQIQMLAAYFNLYPTDEDEKGKQM